MKLEDMRKIAEARTPGEWRCLDSVQAVGTPEIDICFGPNRQCYYFELPLNQRIPSDKNMEFVALAANTYDKLLDVAEAAIACRDDICFGSIEHKLVENFDKALEALEADE